MDANLSNEAPAPDNPHVLISQSVYSFELLLGGGRFSKSTENLQTAEFEGFYFLHHRMP